MRCAGNKTDIRNMETTEKNTHHGHAIKRIRKSMGVKQESLAVDMGITQALVSMYEQKKEIDDEMIARFAKALNVDPQLIKELEEDPLTIIIEQNTFENGSSNNVTGCGDNVNNIYNPIEKIIELSNEKQALYERMLKLEQEKVALLEKLLKEKK